MPLNIKGHPTDIPTANRWARGIEQEIDELQKKAHNVPNVAAKVGSDAVVQGVAISLAMPKEFEVEGSPAGAKGEFDVTWQPELASTALMGPPSPSGPGGNLDTAASASGTTATISVTTTPTQPHEFAVWIGNDNNESSLAPNQSGWTVVSPGTTSTPWTKVISTATAQNVTSTLGGAQAWTSVLAMFQVAEHKTPSIVQLKVHTIASPQAIVFDNPVTAGNTIIAIAGGRDGSVLFPTVSDSLTNSFALAKGVTSTSGNTSHSFMYYASNVLGGADTVTFANGGASNNLVGIIIEVANLSAFSGIPSFRLIQSADVPGFQGIDVLKGTPADGQFLYYKAADGKWEFKSISTGTPNVVSKSANYNASINDVVLCDTSGGGFTVTLPDATASLGGVVTVKKMSSDSNTLTISRLGADTVEGATTAAFTVQYTSLSLIAFGTNWDIF